MNRINALRNIAETRSLAWGRTAGPLVFAAVLIVCSVTVGCSSEKPKPVSSNNQIPVTQPQSPLVPVSSATVPSDSKPAPKKVAHKKPATVNYTDKTYGVTFEYPRRYAIETGNAAADLLTSSPVPMNFVQPGGVALAAVELPETSFANTDFSSAFFNVSVHRNLTAEQCNEFAVPMPKVDGSMGVGSKMDAKMNVQPEAKPEVKSEAKVEAQTDGKSEAKPEAGSAASVASTEAASDSQPAQPVATQPAPAVEQPAVKASADPVPSTEPASNSKLLLGDMELRATEAVSGEGTRQSDSKYFHIYQNGACYEFALNVTTVASSDGLIKHVDRDKVFSRLEKILDTVKINPVTPEATAETLTTPASSGNPAQ